MGEKLVLYGWKFVLYGWKTCFMGWKLVLYGWKNCFICVKSLFYMGEKLVLYEWKTWSLAWREEHRLRAFESKVLSEIFGPDRDRVPGENCVMRSIGIFNDKILYRERIQGEKDGRSMWLTWERKARSIWLGKIEEKRQFGRPRCRWIVLKLVGWTNLS